MSQHSCVSLKELATELGVDKSGLRKFVLKNGIGFCRGRTPDSANQTAIYFTEKQADMVRSARGFFGCDDDETQEQPPATTGDVFTCDEDQECSTPEDIGCGIHELNTERLTLCLEGYHEAAGAILECEPGSPDFYIHIGLLKAVHGALCLVLSGDAEL